MSLHIYTKKEYVPKNIRLVSLNGAYFNGMQLMDDAKTKQILQAVDKATYVSKNTYKKDGYPGELNIQTLSAGCKTLLNILYNPDKCFDTVECGSNALAILPILTDGHAVWENPCVFNWKDMKCDIDLHDETGIKHFKTFDGFLAYTMDGEEIE